MASKPRGPRVQYNDKVREILRKRGEPIPQDVKLQERDGSIRATLMKTAFDVYNGELPEEIRQWYDPDQHAIVIPLPDPEHEEKALSEF